MNNIYGIILCGGSGSRMKSETPKQFLKLADRTLLEHSVKRFNEWGFFKSIVVVANEEHILQTEEIVSKYLMVNDRIVPGGVTRHESALAGLRAIQYDNKDIVIFHDAARPFFQKSELDLVSNAAISFGAATVADNVSDTVVSSQEGRVETILKRDDVFLIKTPQAIHTSLLDILFKENISEEPTDLTSWVLNIGVKAALVPSNPYNIKITKPGDLEFAHKLLDLFSEKTED